VIPRTEQVMSDIQFPVPVRLRLTSAEERVVANSWEALECLSQWPRGARGRAYRAACRVWRDALDGWRRPQEAIRAFVKAARRAGLLRSTRMNAEGGEGFLFWEQMLASGRNCQIITRMAGSQRRHQHARYARRRFGCEETTAVFQVSRCRQAGIVEGQERACHF